MLYKGAASTSKVMRFSWALRCLRLEALAAFCSRFFKGAEANQLFVVLVP